MRIDQELRAKEKNLPALICFSHLRWGDGEGRPQQLMARFAAERRVFYIEQPLFQEGPGLLRMSTSSDGVWSVVPHLPARGLTEDGLLEAQRSLLGFLLEDESVADYILWYYDPRPLRFTQNLSPRAVLYDCLRSAKVPDDSFCEIERLESELFSFADLIIIEEEQLFASKRRQHPNVHLLASRQREGILWDVVWRRAKRLLDAAVKARQVGLEIIAGGAI